MYELYDLHFCFKGNRTYVQGPDIFDEVLKVLASRFSDEKIRNIKYAAHQMLRTDAKAILTDVFEKNDYPVLNSVVMFEIDDKKYYFIIISNDQMIECSNPYSEDVVRHNSIICDSKIIFENSLDDSLTEIIVSMNKYYLQTVVTNSGKWIVTKFDYEWLDETKEVKNQTISLQLMNNFNNKLTKSSILVGEKKIGNLYFTLVEG